MLKHFFLFILGFISISSITSASNHDIFFEQNDLPRARRANENSPFQSPPLKKTKVDDQIDDATNIINNASWPLLDDVSLIVFDYLSGKDFINLSMACRHFCSLSQTPSLFPPQEDKQLFALIESSPLRAKQLFSRISPHQINACVGKLIKQMSSYNKLGTAEEIQTSQKNWITRSTLLKICLGFKSSEASIQFQKDLSDICYAIQCAHFHTAGYPDSAYLTKVRRAFFWEILASEDFTARKFLIRAYSKGERVLLNHEKVKFWESYIPLYPLESATLQNILNQIDDYPFKAKFLETFNEEMGLSFPTNSAA
ncbi:MAG: hypothetical protein BGO77_04060 [Caedibacter sp. 37-49]|nr:MAG: hypothetical protein BGO77_04060 [Caedibacter sp. 37-49]